MGLFWSIKSVDDVNVRFFKKDVTTPMDFHIKAFTGNITDGNKAPNEPLVQGLVQRRFMKPGVKRIPINNGKVHGTIFIPKGTAKTWNSFC